MRAVSDFKFVRRESVDTKLWINQQLRRYLQQLLLQRRNKKPQHLHCLYLESCELNTTKMLQSLGVPECNLCVPNSSTEQDEEGRTPCDHIHCAIPEANVVQQSLNTTLKMSSGTFDFVFADYCCRPDGPRGAEAATINKKPSEDVFELYDGGLLAHGSVLAFTFYQTGAEQALAEFEIWHGKQAVRCGYAATCLDKLFYSNMVCLVYYIVQESTVCATMRDVYAAETLVNFRSSSTKEQDDDAASCSSAVATVSAHSNSEEVCYSIAAGQQIIPACPAEVKALMGCTVYHLSEDVGVWQLYWSQAQLLKVSNGCCARLLSPEGQKYKLWLKKSDYSSSTHSPSRRQWFAVAPMK